MRLKADALFLFVMLLALAPGVSAQDDTDRAEGALFLLLPVGAQGVSLGRAMTWVPGAEGAFWNPAGLAGVDRSQGVLFRGDHVAGTATALTTLFSKPNAGTIAASYFLLDAGEIDQTDSGGNYTGTITIRNHLGIVSAATDLIENLSAGVSFKVIKFQLACRGICADEGTTATTYAIDAGVQGLPFERLRVGAMVAHLGPSLQVLNAEQADPLPARIRVAAAYNIVAEITDTEDLRGWVAVELEDRLRELGATSVYLGTELTAGQVDALSLRAGYVWSDLDQEDGGRVGLGLRYERFDLSIAKSLAVSTLTGETEPVHVTFSIGF
jgi:hypothetical protein